MRTLINIVMLLLIAGLTRSATARPPNVLILVGDDHAPYVMGVYGNSRVRTPALDRLAGQGLRFDRAYCNSPVCTASRQSFLTGRYPRSIGVTQLATPLPESEVTLAEMLAAAGYQTAAIGKMHFNSPLSHGFETRIDLADHRKMLNARGARPIPPEISVLPVWRPFRDPAGVWLNGSCLPFGAVEADMPATYFAQRAAEWLEQCDTERPFFLMVSFYQPHSPFHFPVEYRDRHDPASFDLPKIGPEDDPQIPAIFRTMTDQEKRGATAAYHTSVEFLDTNIGRVLDALDQSGAANDTLVIYLGDHGYMLGQHGRFEKHCSYEPAIRVPLLVRYPSLIPAGTTSEAFVELVDLAPTVLDLCRASIGEQIQGRSLLPLLKGETTEHRDAVIIEYAENEEAALRTADWKLVYCTGKRERQDGYTTGRPLTGRSVRLYDLHADPDEMHDVSGEAVNARVVADLLGRLAEHMRRTARLAENVPDTADPYELLDACLKPQDVTPPPQPANTGA